VELDDSSHDAEDRQSRDEFVDKALDSAGIKVVRVKAKRAYTLAEVEKLIMSIEDSVKVQKERWI
jgi:very-short-patch-repair endonuclease